MLALLVATTPLLITIDPVSAGVALALELALMPLSGVSARSFFLKATPLLLAAPLGALSMLLYASPGGHVYWSFGPRLSPTTRCGWPWASACACARL